MGPIRFKQNCGTMQKTKQNRCATRAVLRCRRCGSDGRFVQFNSYTAELVTPDATVIRLLHSEVDRWECAECGRRAVWIEVPR